MLVTKENIEKERKSWQRFPGHFHELDSTIPIQIQEAEVGSVLRMWMSPNQQRFVFIGMAQQRGEDREVAAIVRDDGNVMHLIREAWVVVLESAPAGFPDLLGIIAQHNGTMDRLAWCGRSKE